MCGGPGYCRGLCIACYNREMTSGRLKRLRDEPKVEYCNRGDECRSKSKPREKQRTFRGNLCRSCYTRDEYLRMTPEKREARREANRRLRARAKADAEAHKTIEQEEEVGNYVEPGAAAGVADHLGQLGPWDEVEELGDGGPSSAAADGVPHRRASGCGMKRLVPAVEEITAVQWGPDWKSMLQTAEQLGERGMLFDIRFATEEARRRGVDIFPELHIMDTRFRTHVVTHGLWVVIYPGYRQFRILSTEELDAQYKEKKK
ncbi:hypothetical protein [Rhodococcus phage REQ1]|uniref:hypothetical protein n=1 Tax=Rhodococcus phage REQ1 TaxID=1109712 RepID=UPI00023EEC01|nr:hypothetical protein RoPhREQ1_gp32 [Rhodococcus phage REQ1]AEV52028.1 hypothetical protein [Rhodococcus phage REQ1]